MKKSKIIIVVIGSLILGLVAGIGLAPWVQSSDKKAPVVGVHQGQVGLINPLLECEGVDFREMPSFMNVIRSRISSDAKLKNVAVYFRDLNNGPWFGINEKQEFVAASLMKVGLLLSFMKATELRPNVLQEKLSLLPEDLKLTEIQQIGNFSELKAGVPYTVEELLSRVIIESDNRPLNALVRSRLAPPLEEVMAHLGLQYNAVKDVGAVLNLKTYATLFRVLYNASYLTSHRSHQALELMTRSTFRDGIVAGVPDGVTVAQKFGERLLDSGQQLHNCGIVYVPGRPYLLCIMTQGQDVASLRRVIQDISKIAYKAVTEEQATLAMFETGKFKDRSEK